MFVVAKNIDIPENKHNNSIPKNIIVKYNAACNLNSNKHKRREEGGELGGYERIEEEEGHTMNLKSDTGSACTLEVTR